MLIKQVGGLSNIKCKNCSNLFDGVGWIISIGFIDLVLCRDCKKGLESMVNLSSKDNNLHVYVSANKQSY